MEANIGIVSACLPTMRPFFRAISPSSLRSRFSKSSTSSDSDPNKALPKLSDEEARSGSGSDVTGSTRVGTVNSVDGVGNDEKRRAKELEFA